MPIDNKGRTVTAELGESSESFLAELFGPSPAVLDEAHENIDKAQGKQKASYARRQLHGAVPAKTAVVPTISESAAVAKVAIESPVTQHSIPAPTVTTAPPDDADAPSTSTAVIPVVTENTPVMVVKQEIVTPPSGHAQQGPNKRQKKTAINEGDFISQGGSQRR